MSEFPRVFGAGPTATGVAVDEYSVLSYAPVYACTAVISGDVGSLPLVLNRVSKDGSKERYEDHKLYELVHDRPNPEMSSMVVRETLQAHALTWGGGYAEIQRDGADRPTAIWPITPDRVTPFRERSASGRSGPLQYRVTNSGGGDVVLQARNMLHIPGMGFDGNVGYSIVRLARESFALGVATERFGATFFGNGSTFGGILSHPSNLTLDVKQGIRESIGAVHDGVDRSHKFIILGGGMKYDRLGIPPNDAQFLETRRFQIAEVARWFGGIPLHKLGDLERATFANIEQQDIEYYKSCLRRWLIRWEQELNYKLISPLERRYQRIEFVVEGLLRGDSQARAEFYSKMFMIGAYSINMILEKENMNKIGPEGDVHYVPANMLAADVAMNGPLVTVTAQPVKPEELTAGDEDEDEEDSRALRSLLSEIAANTTALQTSMAAEREAMSLAEREQHQQAVTRLEEERGHLQRLFDEYREKHANDANALQTELETARAETAEERAAHLVATRALETAQETADRRMAEETAARARAEADLKATQDRVVDAETRAAEAAAIAETATGERVAALAIADAARAEREAALARLTTSETSEKEIRQLAATQLAEAQQRVMVAEARAVALMEEQHVKAEAASEAIRQRDDAEAKAAALAAAQADSDRHRAEAAAALVAQQNAVNDERAARDVAETALRAVTAAREVAAEAAAVAERRATDEAQARATAEASERATADALAAQRHAEMVRLTGMLTAHRALIVDAVRRILAPEMDKARGHQATSEKLRRWVETFYVMHEDKCLDTLRPVMRAHLVWKQSTDDVDAVTIALVRDHITESQRQLRAIVDSEPNEMHANLERMLQRWERERPEAVADRVLREEVEYVRTYR